MFMSSPSAVPENRPPKLDKLSFAKYMKNIGRSYRKQAMELISICRIFVQVGEQSISQDVDLRKVLEVVDDALSSAADIKSKTSEGTDVKFKEAINALGDYERKYHPKQQSFTNGQQDVTECPPVAERMKSAKENDKSSSRALHKLKESFKAKLELVEGPTKVARFLLPRSLNDERPDVVEQVLGEETRVEEILWNFSRLKGNQRVTLKQNPHFYTGLPKLACGYSDEFISDPIDKFWDATEISVLTHERSRVFLETDDRKRAFGNFWVPDEAIIFKDIGGRLEGERVVAADIRGTPNLWHREDPRVPTVVSLEVKRSTTGPAIPSDLPPINTNPVRGRIFDDWRQLVRDTLGSPNISVCISTKGTPPESPNDWVLSSPTNPTPSSPAQPLSTSQARSTGATALPQIAALQIPMSSPGPPTTLSYNSARPPTCSPVSRTPQTLILPPFASPPTRSPRKPSATASPSSARSTPIPQDLHVAVLSSMALTVAMTPPQARLSPGVLAQSPESPPQKAASTGISKRLTAGDIASPPSNTTLTPPTNDLARSSGLRAGDGQVGNRTSVIVSMPAPVNAQAPSPGQQQSKSAAPPVQDTAQTQGKKPHFFQKILKYFWD